MTQTLTQFLDRGGPAMWVIAALSVATLAMILWKLWRLSLTGAFSSGRAKKGVALWRDGARGAALDTVSRGGGMRADLARTAMAALQTLADDDAREETARVARAHMAETRAGLRLLELVTTIAPLIGLLGTVLGMIEAFQALQAAGSSSDPAALAGGIWEALLTTAAGMAVAIPAGMALSWFDGVADGLAHDFEDIAARIFVTPAQEAA